MDSCESSRRRRKNTSWARSGTSAVLRTRAERNWRRRRPWVRSTAVRKSRLVSVTAVVALGYPRAGHYGPGAGSPRVLERGWGVEGHWGGWFFWTDGGCRHGTQAWSGRSGRAKQGLDGVAERDRPNTQVSFTRKDLGEELEAGDVRSLQ